METGCQNIQLCVVILKVVFPLEVIGPMFLFPLIYITMQCTEALLLALCYRCYQTFKWPSEGKGHSCPCVFVQWDQEEASRCWETHGSSHPTADFLHKSIKVIHSATRKSVDIKTGCGETSRTASLPGETCLILKTQWLNSLLSYIFFIKTFGAATTDNH